MAASGAAPEQSIVSPPASAGGAFVSGFFLPLRGARVLLTTRGLKRYAIAPLIVNAILYAGVMALFFWLLANWDVAVGPWEFWGPVGGWLASAVNYAAGALKWIIAVPLIFLLCYFSFTIVGMIIGSPFYDLLSEKVENAICRPREAGSMSLRLTVGGAVLSVYDAIWIGIRQVFWTVLTLPLLLIPVVGFVPLFAVGAYFTGLGLFDVAMARNYLRNRHKEPVLRAVRWRLLGLGVCMQLLFLIPFLGLLLLPIGVTGATLLYCRCDWSAALSGAGLKPPKGFQPPRIEGST